VTQILLRLARPRKLHFLSVYLSFGLARPRKLHFLSMYLSFGLARPRKLHFLSVYLSFSSLVLWKARRFGPLLMLLQLRMTPIQDIASVHSYQMVADLQQAHRQHSCSYSPIVHFNLQTNCSPNCCQSHHSQSRLLE